MFAHAARAAGRVAGGALAVYWPVRAAASACAAVPRAAGCAIWGASGVARQCAASSGDRLANSPRAVTETRRRQTPPTHPPQPPPADQHAALACAGWPVRPQSKMPWTTCAPSASRMKRPSARSTSRPKSSTTTPPTTPFGTPHMWRPLWCRRAPPVRLGASRLGGVVWALQFLFAAVQSGAPSALSGCFGLASSSSSSLGLHVFLAPCKGWWVCCSVATPRVSMLRRTLQALSAAGGQSSQH